MSSEYNGDLGLISHEKGTGCLFHFYKQQGASDTVRTHRTNPDVNCAGGTTFSPRSLRDTGAWNAAITQAVAIHTFASAKDFPGHTLKGRRIQISSQKLWRCISKCSLPPPKAENEVLRIRLLALWSILVQESLWVELVGVCIHLFVPRHRPMPR